MRLSDGTPIRDDRAYTLATNDYLADGGDAMTTLTIRRSCGWVSVWTIQDAINWPESSPKSAVWLMSVD
jgi:hypothetical protein